MCFRRVWSRELEALNLDISNINQPSDSGKITNDSDRHATKVSGIIWAVYCAVHGQRLVFYSNTSTFAKYTNWFLSLRATVEHHIHVCRLHLPPPIIYIQNYSINEYLVNKVNNTPVSIANVLQIGKGKCQPVVETEWSTEDENWLEY